MKRLTVLAFIALAARAEEPGFRFQLDRLAAQAQAQLAATDAAIYRATHQPLVALQKPVAAAPRELDPVEREALRAALERGVRCMTGKLVKDTASALWVPELKARCQ